MKGKLVGCYAHFLLLVFGLSGANSVSLNDKEIIESIHNSLRAIVQPEAADMQYMTYHDEAENLAQSWANECKSRLTHNRPVDKVLGNCGQNIHVSATPVTWEKVVKNNWYGEVRNFSYGGNNDFSTTGYYTQVVWAQSHKVGCGVAFCRDAQGQFFNYVCNYCPAGNYPDRLNRPYKRGPRCGTCPNSCYYGLCF